MRLTALLTLTTALVSVTGWPVASGPNLAAELLRRQDTGTLGPAPANRTGCVAHGDHWDCDPIEGEEEHDHDHKAEEAAATGNSTVTEVHDHDHDHDHANSTTSAVNATATAVPAGCEQRMFQCSERYADCRWRPLALRERGRRDCVERNCQCNYDSSSRGLRAAYVILSPLSDALTPDGDHWHCENEADEIAMNGGTSAAAEVAGDDTCVIHCK
jgi:hypothetical protein